MLEDGIGLGIGLGIPDIVEGDDPYVVVTDWLIGDIGGVFILAPANFS
jgi:hypothetical protein